MFCGAAVLLLLLIAPFPPYSPTLSTSSGESRLCIIVDREYVWSGLMDLICVLGCCLNQSSSMVYPSLCHWSLAPIPARCADIAGIAYSSVFQLLFSPHCSVLLSSFKLLFWLENSLRAPSFLLVWKSQL